MILKRIYSIHFLLTTFIFINGCGIKPNPSEIPVFSINAAIKSVEDLNTYERNIATSICYALESKSKNFKTTDYLGTRFIFETKQKVCDVQGPSTNINTALTLLTDGTFHYNTTALNFNDFSQTDTSGYLSQVCTKIKNNEAISNTTTVNGLTVQVTFFKNNLDGYMVQYFTKLASGVAQMTSAETFKIRTQLTYTLGNIMGMDEYYSKQTICSSNPKLVTTEEQTFISR